MNSFATARVVVVAGEPCCRDLMQRLARMGFASVERVACLELARHLCATGAADACLVVLPPEVPDERPAWTALAQAPGDDLGVPSLLLAAVIPPALATAARKSGYVAAIPAGIAQRLLYRFMGALLQNARRSLERDGEALGTGNAFGPRRPRLRTSGSFGRERRDPPKSKLQ